MIAGASYAHVILYIILHLLDAKLRHKFVLSVAGRDRNSLYVYIFSSTDVNAL